jgi:hypothetical protein
MRRYWWRIVAGLLLIAGGTVLLLSQLGWIALSGSDRSSGPAWGSRLFPCAVAQRHLGVVAHDSRRRDAGVGYEWLAGHTGIP